MPDPNSTVKIIYVIFIKCHILILLGRHIFSCENERLKHTGKLIRLPDAKSFELHLTS
jgi:hypothetical protein